MHFFSRLKNVFGGKSAAGQTPASGVEGYRLQVAGLLAEFDGHLQRHMPAEAEATCQRYAALVAECAASERGIEAQRFLADALFDLGGCYRSLQKKQEAEQAYGQALEVCQALLAEQPGDAQAKSRMAACQNHLGLVYLEAGEFSRATEFFKEALALREEMRAATPQDEENLVYLGGTLCNLGVAAREQGDAQTALDWYHRSIDVLDRSIPGCDCGCRDMFANMMTAVTGRPSPTQIAAQYLQNALYGRAQVLDKLGPDQRFRHVRRGEHGDHTVAALLPERLAGGDTLPEIRRELLDVISFARGPIIFDLHTVKDMDAQGAALLLHLRGRLVGMGEWPALVGLSDQLRAATPAVAWDQHFACYATIDAALEGENG